MKKIAYLIISSALLLLSSCGDGGSEDAFEQAMTDDSTYVDPELSSELVSEVIKSIPSPVEMSSLIREVESHYSSDILNDVDNVDNYTTNYKKAVNIGIYGTDLGYVNIYNQKQDAIIYLKAMTDLAEQLKIGQFFDVHLIKRLATNSKNLDSLLYITTSNYDKMNTYLQEQKRGNLSMLMLTGGWLEALYIATEVTINNKNEQLIQRVGEQKVVLDQIIILLDFYKSDPNVKNLKDNLEKLKAIYDQVEIVTVYEEPTIEEVNGVLMVTDNSTSTIKITFEEVVKVAEIVKGIREELLK